MMALQKDIRRMDVAPIAWAMVGVALSAFALLNFDRWFISETPMAQDYAQAMTVACGVLLAFGQAFFKKQAMIPVGLVGVMLLSAPSWFGQASVPEKMILQYVSLVLNEEVVDVP